VRVVLQLLESAESLDFPVFNNNNVVREVQKVDRVGHQNPRLVPQQALKHMLEYLLADVGIESRYRIVHQDDIGVRIDGPREAYSGFLPTRQVDALFADFSLVSVRQNLKVSFQLARLDGLAVSLFFVRLAKQNVVADRHILDPRTLLHVRNGPSYLYGLLSDFEVGLKETSPQAIKLFLGSLMVKTAEVVDLGLWHVNQVTDDSLEQAGLARAHVADDAHELPLLRLQPDVGKRDKLLERFPLGLLGLSLVELSDFLATAFGLFFLLGACKSPRKGALDFETVFSGEHVSVLRPLILNPSLHFLSAAELVNSLHRDPELNQVAKEDRCLDEGTSHQSEEDQSCHSN